MATDTEAAAFRLQAEAHGLVLRTPDAEEPRFVFELQAGSIVTSAQAKIARQFMLLAEALYAPDRGEARELARLVARRDALEDEESIVLVVWRHASHAHASDPGSYDRKEWISFEDWLKDQFLLEDLLAALDEGVPI